MATITGIPCPVPFLQVPGEPPVPWGQWLKTFDNYLLAIDLDSTKNEARCRALLISCLGAEGQRILYTFPEPDVATLHGLKSKLKSYFVTVTSKWSHRVKFCGRRQRTGESIESFSADLRQLAASCNFEKVTDPLNEALLGQFINGIQDNRVKAKFLLEDDAKLDFNKAVEIAKEYELSLIHI